MYTVLKAVFGPVIRWFGRPRVEGRMPEGAVILAPNHSAEFDSLILGAALPRRLTFVAKSEYFDAGWRGQLYGRLCRWTGQIPINRLDPRAAAESLEAAREVLRAGGVWVIYPEGTRSPDGRLYKGHTGAMRVALSVPGVRVVPVAVTGTRQIDAPGRRGWRRGRTRIVLGEPLDLSRWSGGPRTSKALRETTDELMGHIQRLSGLEYVDRHPTQQEMRARDAGLIP